MTTVSLPVTIPRSGGSYAGLASLLRLAWRRDRWLITLTCLGLTALAAGSARATIALYPDPAQAQDDLAAVLDNPAVIAMYGPLASHTVDALATFKTLLMGAIILVLLAHAVVRRHTRAEEEDGRAELLGAGAVGRRAPLAAAIVLAAAAVLGISLASGLSLIAAGLDPTGSLTLAAAWSACGLVFVGVAAVAAQLASTSRGVAGITLGTLAVTFLVRMAADTLPAPGLRWLSPLGWVTQMSVFGANRWWLVVPAAVLAVGLGGVAVSLLERRDLGAGVLPARQGPDHGSLGSVAGLLARTLRPTILGWSTAVVVLGSVVGSLVGAVGDMVADPKVRDMLEMLAGSAGSIEDIFVRTELLFAGAAVAAAGLAALGRLSTEERVGRGELLLAHPVTRLRWYLTHVAYAVGLVALLLTLVGGAMGLAAARALDRSVADQLAALVPAALAVLPAVLLVLGIGALVHGLSPRWGTVAWGVLAVSFLLGELGPSMDLPAWVVDLSPFAHLSQLPGGSFAGSAALVLTAIAALLTAAGAAAYLRRDLG